MEEIKITKESSEQFEQDLIDCGIDIDKYKESIKYLFNPRPEETTKLLSFLTNNAKEEDKEYKWNLLD